MKKVLGEIAADYLNPRLSLPLPSSEQRRARVGGYRILLLISNGVLLVTDIASRGQIYKKL